MLSQTPQASRKAIDEAFAHHYHLLTSPQLLLDACFATYPGTSPVQQTSTNQEPA